MVRVNVEILAIFAESHDGFLTDEPPLIAIAGQKRVLVVGGQALAGKAGVKEASR